MDILCRTILTFTNRRERHCTAVHKKNAAKRRPGGEDHDAFRLRAQLGPCASYGSRLLNCLSRPSFIVVRDSDYYQRIWSRRRGGGTAALGFFLVLHSYANTFRVAGRPLRYQADANDWLHTMVNLVCRDGLGVITSCPRRMPLGLGNR